MQAGMERGEPTGQIIVLPEKLAAIVSPQQVWQNELELLDSTPVTDHNAFQAARLALLNTFLVHGTMSNSAFEKGILPYVEAVQVATDVPGEPVGMTFIFDKSLGLDECVFFSWPIPQYPREYNKGRWVLVSSEILLDDHCFVTPKDIYEVATCILDEHGNAIPDEAYSDKEWTQFEGVYEEVYESTYQDLISGPSVAFDYDGAHIPKAVVKAVRERVRQQFFNLYFTKIVSGAAWLEYLARVLAVQGPSGLPLGEIKFTGTVPPNKIEAILGDEEFVETYISHVMQGLAGSASHG